MLKFRFSRLIGLGFAVVLLVTGFQNCSAPPGGASSNSGNVASQNLNGNGVGYDGMTNYDKVLAKACGDGSRIETRVTKSSGGYTLVRDHCQDVTPVVLNAADLVTDPLNSDVLIYASQILTDNGTQVHLYCMDSSGGASLMFDQSPNVAVYMDAQAKMEQFSYSSSSPNVYSGQAANGDSLQLSLSSAANGIQMMTGTLSLTLSGAVTTANVNCFQE